MIFVRFLLSSVIIFEIDFFSYFIVASRAPPYQSSFSPPPDSPPLSFAAKTRLAFTYYFTGESIHSSSKDWHPAGGTIALSGRFRLIESGREKKSPRQRGKPGRVDLSSRGLQPGVKRKVRGARRYKVLFTPSSALSLFFPPSNFVSFFYFCRVSFSTIINFSFASVTNFFFSAHSIITKCLII